MAQKEIGYRNSILRISYRIVNNRAKKNMLFLHGWGSNKEVMEIAFKDCFKDFNHIYVDLPHFGASGAEIFLDTYDYAKVMERFLDNICINDRYSCDIVVGHSFGGKIALLLRKEIILLSSAGILLPKPLKVKMKIALAKLVKRLGIQTPFLKADDAKNLSPIAYEIFKHVVCEDFAQQYANFKTKASIFWGKEDRATPLESFQMICTLMPHAKTCILEGDHYFFLKQGKEIERLYRLS